jgi:hypothetical protein
MHLDKNLPLTEIDSSCLRLVSGLSQACLKRCWPKETIEFVGVTILNQSETRPPKKLFIWWSIMALIGPFCGRNRPRLGMKWSTIWPVSGLF